MKMARPAPAPPAPSPIAPPGESVPRSPSPSAGRRPLLDLFPPAPTPATAPASPSAPAPAPAPALLAEAPPPPERPRRPTLIDALAPPAEETLTYEPFYGLAENPFSLSSDPRFLYYSVSHDRVAQELLSAIRGRERVVVLTGEPGTGKTTVCRAVIDQLDRRTLTSFVFDPFTSVEDLIETVLVDFGVISRDDLMGGRLARASLGDLTTALHEFLLSLAPLQAFAVVLIDEAQGLLASLLNQIRVLSELQGSERLLQVVLVGQPKLLKMLGRSELKALAQHVSVRSRLEPLAEDEIIGYVLHRLAVAGTNARVEFADQALARLYELSAGVPRAINMLCDRALALGFDSTTSVIDRALIDRAGDDLDIAPPESRGSRIARAMLAGAAIVALMLVGAGAAALVFHDRVAEMIVSWRATPSPPNRPPLRLPAPLAAPAPPEIAAQPRGR